jgi:Methyltransferase domain
MSLGERAALAGLVAQLKPKLSIEIGTAEGGSLERIAAHSGEVHALDLSDELLVRCPPNATFHKGNSRTTLPKLLAGFAAERRNVDFVLVDGDHSSQGVRADLEALLASPAIARTLILLHDSFHPEVRSGIESVAPGENPKVAGFDLDFVPGRLGKLGGFADQFLGGFALVLVDDALSGRRGRKVELGFWSLNPTPILFHDAFTTLRRAAQLIDAASVQRGPTKVAHVRLEPAHIARAQLQRELDSMRSSWSWRITAPLRAPKAWLRRLRRRA